MGKLSEIPEKILVVEDDTALRALIEEECGDAGFEVQGAADADFAWKMVQRWQPDLIISDLRLPGHDGLWLLDRINELTEPPGFIMMTAFGTVPQAVKALKQGANDFLTKPLDLDHLMICVQRTIENRRMRMDMLRYRKLLGDNGFHGIIGHSAVMRRLFASLKQVAKALGPVLITGESGTGKDLVAQAIHQESPRNSGPFIAVNCAAIPGELQESEFFGHAAGSFTGAETSRKGLFAEACEGTLFLDEIGDMPLRLQAKLLRILEDGLVRPIGVNHETRFNVRVIAATNHDLEERVAAGLFREDLYFRLETFMLHVPPLRERDDDIDLLIARFIKVLSAQMDRNVCAVSGAALKLLHEYPFPGNVRELRNAIERAVAFCNGTEIKPDCLPKRIRKHRYTQRHQDPLLFSTFSTDEDLLTLDEMANKYTSFVLERLNGNKRRAAQLLDISRATLYRRLGVDSSGAPNSRTVKK